MATPRLTLSLLAAALVATSSNSFAQTQPAAVPVPFVTAAAGVGNVSTTVCAGGILSTDGSAFGDGCPATQVRLSAPQGAAVDKYGNIYVADYNDKQVRVVYNGGAALAAAITAANSGYAISATRSAPAPTPVVGSVYTLAGVGASATTFTAISAASNACANYAASGQPAGLNTLGDGCPGASAPVAARDVKFDADGNLFLSDYSNGRVRVFCVNCATTTLAAKLIMLENPTVTAPVNGAMYTVAGFASGYRDAAPGYNSASNAAGATAAQNIALLRLPTGVAISASDDVFIADNTNNAVRVLYNGGPMAKSILVAQGTAAPVQGYVYTIAGAGCVSAATSKTGSVSSANACLTMTGSDTGALGNTVGTGPVWSVYLDGNSNVFYSDATNQRVKVIYGGVAKPAALTATLSTGFTYSFAGQGTGVPGAQDGVAPSALVFSSMQGVGGDAYGNVFLLDYGTGLLYEVYAQTGIAAIIGGGSTVATTPAAGVPCSGLTTGPVMTDAFYDGCPATQAKFTSPRGPVVADGLGNLYFGDALGYLVRMFSYSPTFAPAAVGATGATQSYAFSFLSASAITSTSFDTAGAAAADFMDGGSDTCTSALTIAVGAPGTTCVVNVTFTPKAAGPRAGAVLLNGAAGVLGSVAFTGVGNGAALALDPATFTTTGTGYTPAGIAVDGAGRVLISDTTGKKVVRFAGGTATTLATGFTSPSGVAVDNAGNVFLADSGAGSLVVVPVVGAQFTANALLSAPKQVTTDSLGRIYVADSGNNRVVVFGAGGTKNFSVLGFSGLTAPGGVAVDASFNVYAADATHIVKLTPLGVQSTFATQSGVSTLSLDAAGDLYTASGMTLSEFTPTATKVALYTALGNATAATIDAAGNVYVADTNTGGLDTLARTAGYFKFLASPGVATINLTSIGNVSVASTAYTVTNTTDFSVAAASTNGCSGALAPGTTCALTASFTQVSTSIPTDVLSFTSPVVNGSPSFTLTAASAAPAITVTAAPSSLAYGKTVTLNATVYGPGNTSGTVTFYVGGTKLTSVAVSSTATASYTYTPAAAGSYVVTADYTPTGATAASVTTATSASFTVTKATPTVAATVSPATGFSSSTFTVTATIGASYGTPAGTVVFMYGTTTSAPVTVSGGTASLSITGLPAGVTCITAIYSGNQNFNTVTSACANATVVTQVTPSITLGATPAAGYPTTAITLTSVVSSPVATPTGGVTFYSGTTLLGTAALDMNGMAVATFTGLPVGVDCVTAVYGATPNFASVTSSCVTVTISAGFGVSAASQALAFQVNYQEAQTQLNITTGGRTDTLTFSCAGLPSKLNCAFSPATVTLAGGSAVVPVQLLVSNSGATYGALQVPGMFGVRTVTLALAPFAALLLMGLRRRKRLPAILTALLLLSVAAGMTGCSGQDPTTLRQAPGTYQFTVNVMSGSSTVQSLPFTLTIP